MTGGTEFDYPPEWAPPGAEPPRRPSYAPKPRSGVYGYTGDEPQEDDGTDYPEAWRW
jgi:hypothetical protein